MADCLLLNASGLPVSILPLSTLNWQMSIKFLFLEKADVILWHDDWVIKSVNWETKVPSVIMLKEYRKPKTAVKFGRSSIFIRDNGQCQYCGIQLSKSTATIDHVIPTSKGGTNDWLNCTLCCGPCNVEKGDTYPWRAPYNKPYEPEYFDLVNKRKKLDFNIKHQEWLEFI